MNNIYTIIKREYLTRVKKKSFVIMTLITPILMALIVFLPIIIMKSGGKDEKSIAVYDESSQFSDAFQSTETLKFDVLNSKPDSLQKFYNENSYYAIVIIPENFRKDSIFIYSEKAISVDVKETIKYFIDANIELQNLLAQNIDPNVLAAAKESIPIKTLVWSKSGELQESLSEVNMILGFISAFVIYMFIFMYGAQLMRGTMEEKTGRVVEILVSSAKPFQLMMGKVIGIAAVALTQFGIWIITIFLLFIGTKGMIMESAGNQLFEVFKAIQNINSGMWIFLFLFYFIGGYLLYGSLFAAVGSAVDNETDTQQFILPLTLPLILAFVFAQSIITNPDGPLAVWMSVIPLTSPLVMMVRIGFGVPFLQICISVVALILTFILTIYVAAKIYRIGILSYGKKVTYADLWKWIRYKN